jgi:hypothetical protein
MAGIIAGKEMVIAGFSKTDTRRNKDIITLIGYDYYS